MTWSDFSTIVNLGLLVSIVIMVIGIIRRQSKIQKIVYRVEQSINIIAQSNKTEDAPATE